MHSEKEIVNLWLNRKGFFTIESITAGKNREIDILALKEDKTNEVWHVEIVSSVTSIDTVPVKDILGRFNNKNVINTLTKTIKKHIPSQKNYKKILVVGKTSKLSKLKEQKDITVYRLSDILFEVFTDLDTHNYRTVSLRTIQLVKYMMLSDPLLLARMLDKEEGNNVLNLNTREIFLNALMEQDETKRVLSKNSFEPELIKVIKNSTLNRPEKLAKALEEKILSKRSRKKFLETLLKYNEVKQEIKTIEKNQRTLSFFAK